MKRNPKPFSVEIKKSRAQGQRHQLLPRRLFGIIQVEPTQVFQKEEPQAVAEPVVVPRILPSILEPVWSNTEAVESVHRKRSLGPKIFQDQMEFDLNAIAPEDAKDAPAETPVTLEAVSQTDVATVVEEAATPVHEVQAQKTESAKAKSRKPRKTASKMLEPETASKPMFQLEQALETEVIEPLLVERSRNTDHRLLTERQAAAAQLPRHERWKRRLHPTVW
jgi:hypothetical protein